MPAPSRPATPGKVRAPRRQGQGVGLVGGVVDREAPVVLVAPTSAARNPRLPDSAYRPSAATARPTIRLLTVALFPPCCRARNQGEMATQSPESMPSITVACASTLWELVGARCFTISRGERRVIAASRHRLLQLP
jgi:hypothetical protein